MQNFKYADVLRKINAKCKYYVKLDNFREK